MQRILWNNVIIICDEKSTCKNIIFASTAAVYDLNKNESLVENDELKPQMSMVKVKCLLKK